MPLGQLETEAINTTLKTEEGLEYDFLEDKPEGLNGPQQIYLQDNLNDIILVIILISLTVFNFFAEANLATLNFFHLVILLTGYTLGKRFAVHAAFLTILIVWAFILADANPYLRYLNEIELNLHMTLWGGLLIMMGWFGSFLAKIFHKNPEEASPAEL